MSLLSGPILRFARQFALWSKNPNYDQYMSFTKFPELARIVVLGNSKSVEPILNK